MTIFRCATNALMSNGKKPRVTGAKNGAVLTSNGNEIEVRMTSVTLVHNKAPAATQCSRFHVAIDSQYMTLPGCTIRYDCRFRKKEIPVRALYIIRPEGGLRDATQGAAASEGRQHDAIRQFEWAQLVGL